MSIAFRLALRAVRYARRALDVARGAAPSHSAVLVFATLLSSAALAGFTAAPAAANTIQVAGITVSIDPASPCSGDSVRVLFSTCACATRFTEASIASNGAPRLRVAIDPTIVCVRCDSLAAGVTLGQFAAGSYGLEVEIDLTYGHDGVVDSTRSVFGTLGFSVRQDCGASSIPYLEHVEVGPPGPCVNCPRLICPGDSIPVFLNGGFPDFSLQLAEVRVTPSAAASPLPQPDVVQVFYSHTCGGDATAHPWSAAVRIGPLLARSYDLRVEGYLVDHCAGDSVQFLGALGVPFTVSDSCVTPPPPPPCFIAGFPHTLGSACDAMVGANQPAQVTLGVSTTVALAGLQGRLAFDVPGLKITNMEPVGNASGMLLSWQARTDGASFVLVATSGAPILPATSLPVSHPVLRVTVAVQDSASVPDQDRLVPLELVASDAAGGVVEQCALREPYLYIDVAAHLCRSSACDFNSDGVTDVRDLVVMAHCILDPSGPCPPGAADHLDCNGDGAKDVGDVLCCARLLLAGLPGAGGGNGRPAPDVTLTFGRPVSTATGVDVPVTLSGLAGVGAARLDFDYPAGSFDAVTIEPLAGQAGGWLALDQASGGDLTLGLVALGTNATGSVPLVAHLTLRAGGAVSGSFGVHASEFAGTDGVTLTTTLAGTSTPLAGGGGLVLSAPRPNPFAAETRFSVSLPVAEALEVSVYDLLGRRVATLFHGPGAAGTTSFAWNRTRADGAFAASGIYFLRVTAGSAVAGRKILVLSRE